MAGELRQGVPKTPPRKSTSPDVLKSMGPDLVFDYLSVRINAARAQDKSMILNFNFKDINQKYTVSIGNSVLNYTKNIHPQPDVTISLNKSDLFKLFMGQGQIEQELNSPSIKVDGNVETIKAFKGLIDEYQAMFNIVEP